MVSVHIGLGISFTYIVRMNHDANLFTFLHNICHTLSAMLALTRSARALISRGRRIMHHAGQSLIAVVLSLPMCCMCQGPHDTTSTPPTTQPHDNL